MEHRKKKRRLSLTSSINLISFKFIFRIFARFRPVVPEPILLNSTSRVLCFTSTGLGDALLDSVAIRALAETFPGIRISAVAHHRRMDIARHNPYLENVFSIRKGIPGFLQLWKQLRAAGPWDCVLYLSCLDPEAPCIGYLLNKHRTAGLAWRSEMGFLRAWNLEEPVLRRAHLSQQALRVALQAGATTTYPRMLYQVAENDRIALGKFMKDSNIHSYPSVILQLGGGGAAYRDWPVTHFVDLADMLHQAGVGPLSILGGTDHKEKAGKFMELAGQRGISLYNFVGRLAFPLSAALIGQAKCLVSTDTGIMHLGFALGTPTAAILHCSPGAARVGLLADLEKHRLIELAKPPGYQNPEDAQMRDIPPEIVLPKILDILNRQGMVTL